MQATIGPPALNGVSLAANDDPTLNAGFFKGIRTSIAKNPYFCDFFQGEGVRTPPRMVYTIEIMSEIRVV